MMSRICHINLLVICENMLTKSILPLTESRACENFKKILSIWYSLICTYLDVSGWRSSRGLRQLRRARSDNYHCSYIVGHSERMQAVFDLVARVACSDASVLIMGESGTGKEVIARAIHEQSNRSS